MNWKTLAVATTREGLDDLEEALWEAGAVSVTVEDGGERPLFEPGPGELPLWDDIVVTGMFEEGEDLLMVRAELDARGYTTLFVDELQDRVWEREWLSRFRPMRFGHRLWVCPAGQEPPEPNAIVMHLDPGLAFGTGTHATTRLCLEWLDHNLSSGARVLDFGCGSGILGIAALLLGARAVTGVDNDPQAIVATRENAVKNGVEDKMTLFLPEQMAPGQYDVVLANILAQPLIDLAPRLQGYMLSGADLVLSGIMENQVDWVIAAYPALRFDVELSEGWARLAGRMA